MRFRPATAPSSSPPHAECANQRRWRQRKQPPCQQRIPNPGHRPRNHRPAPSPPPRDETGGPRKARTRQPRKCPAPVARKSHRPLANSTGAASTGCALDYAVLILQSIEYGLPIAEDDPRPAEGSSGAHGAGPRTRRSPRKSRTATARPPFLCCAIQIAAIYRVRWSRLRETDPSKAAEARQQVADWAYA